MGILQNYNEGNMDRLRTVKHSDTGTDKPYVVKDINNPPSNNSNTLGLQVNKRVDDTSRIAQMLVSKPGLKFLANEALLKQTELTSKIGKGKLSPKDIVKQVGGTAAHVLKVAGSTLAQVPVNGTGTHFLRGFRTDTRILSAEAEASTFAQLLGAGGVEGAPLAKNGATIIPDGTPNDGLQNFSIADDLKDQISPLLGPEVDEEPKGTVIPLDVIDGESDPFLDFQNEDKQAAQAIDYNATSIARVKLGDQGVKENTKRVSYDEPSPELKRDMINMSDVGSETIGEEDFVQLEFEIITPEESYFLQFRSFLTTLDDSFNGSWNESKYLGRADNFYTYQGFSRSINLGFIVAAATREEMKPLYRKMTTLASVTAPTYGDNGKFMRGSLARITVGDYIYKVPGVIESVQYNWQKDYPWEIKEGTAEDMQVLPHALDATISFKVIHDFTPETGIKPFITNSKEIAPIAKFV